MKIMSETQYFSIANARLALAVILLTSLTGCDEQSDLIVLSVIGTNDVHGELLPRQFKGGLTTLSDYVAALRAAREDDGGSLTASEPKNDSGKRFELTKPVALQFNRANIVVRARLTE